MAIPVATTRIRVRRAPDDGTADTDPWESPASPAPWPTVAEGVRAVISVGGGTYAGRTVGPGDAESVTFTLACDPCGLTYLDVVEDEVSGATYQVEWAIFSPGLSGALASDTAGLSTRKGS